MTQYITCKLPYCKWTLWLQTQVQEWHKNKGNCLKYRLSSLNGWAESSTRQFCTMWMIAPI